MRWRPAGANRISGTGYTAVPSRATLACPSGPASCHQKRMLAYGEWLEETLLSPVPHRLNGYDFV